MLKKAALPAVLFFLLVMTPAIISADDDVNGKSEPKIGTLDNPTVKKERDEITPSDYGDSFQIIGGQNINTYMKIVDKLILVKEGKMDPETFFKDVSAIEMPEGKQMRHVLMQIKKDIGNHLGRNGIEKVFGDIYQSGSTLVESELLPHRARVVKNIRDEAIRIYAETKPPFSIFYSEVGSWATEKPKQMKFAGDIDFSFMSGSMEDAMKLKQIYDDLIYKRFGKTPEEMDIPCTAHGMATGEVFVGKPGQSQVEGVMKKSGAKVTPICFGENGKKIGLKKQMDFKEALDIMLLEAEVAKTPLPDLEELNWKEQPGVSYEMARHFEHDIMRTDVYTNLESFVKAAKYLDRSFTALEQDKGKGAVKNKKLRALVQGLVEVKKNPKAQVELLKDYYGGKLPYEAKLELNDKGKGKAELIADQKLVKEFWDTCNKALWDDANATFKEVSNELKNKLRKVSSKDPQNARTVYDELNKYVEMMEIEDRILTDPKAGIGENLNDEYKANMAEFRDVVKEFKQRAGKTDLLKVIEPAKADYYKFIDQQLKVDTPSSLRLAAVAMTQVPGQVNDILDFMDDGLLNEFRYGETKEFDTFLRKGRNLSWNEQADQFLKGTGLEGYHSNQLEEMEVQAENLRKGASKWMNNKLKDLCKVRGISVIERAAGAAGSAAGYVSGSIKKVNNTFSQSVASSRGGQAMMSGMMIYNLSQEVPLYVNLVANGDMEGLAVEFFKRRVPFGGAVEKAVMGDYLGVAWEVTATVLPPASLAAAAKSIGETIGHETFDYIWSSELESFIDNLYDKAQFAAAGVETTGDNIKISQWELVSVTYRGSTYDMNELIQSEKDGAREMAACMKLPLKERETCFPMEKVNDGIFEWWKTSTAFQEAFKKTDPWIQLITEMSTAPHVGKKLKDHFYYQKETRWEQIKVEFLQDLKTTLEERRAGEQTLLSGSFVKVYDELMIIAGKLDIRPQVEKALNDEFGGMTSEAVDYIKDLIKGTIRELTGDADIWDRQEEMATYVTSAARTYKQIWDGRLAAELNMPGSHGDQGLRILTGPYFLTGIYTEDGSLKDRWAFYPSAAKEKMIEHLIDIKIDGDIEPPHLALNEKDYDKNILDQLINHEMFREMWKHVHGRVPLLEPPVVSYLGKDEAKQTNPGTGGGPSDQDRALERFKHHEQRIEEIMNEFRAHYGVSKQDELTELRQLRDQAVALTSEICISGAAVIENVETMTSSIDNVQDRLYELEKKMLDANKAARDLESIEARLTSDHESAEELAVLVGDGNATAEADREVVCSEADAMQHSRTNSERDRLYNNASAAYSGIKPAFETARAEFKTLEGIGGKTKEVLAMITKAQQTAQSIPDMPEEIASVYSQVKSELTATQNLLTAEANAKLEQLNEIITASKGVYTRAKKKLEPKRKSAEGAALWEEMGSLNGEINSRKKAAAGCLKEPEAVFNEKRSQADQFINRYTAAETNLNRIHKFFLPDKDGSSNLLFESALEKTNLIDLLVSLGKGYIESCVEHLLMAKLCMDTAESLSMVDLSKTMPSIVGMSCKEGVNTVAASNIDYQVVSAGRAAHPNWEHRVESTEPAGGSQVSLEETIVIISCYEELNIPAYLATIDCSSLPGSTAVYNPGLRKGVCDCLNGAVFNPSKTRCIDCRQYENGFANAFNAGNLEDAQAWVNESVSCGWAANAQAHINAEHQRRVCETVAANLRNACKTNSPHAVHAIMSEARNRGCRIDPNLLQWGLNIVENYNNQLQQQIQQQNNEIQRQAEQRTRENQRQQQQFYNNMKDMMEQALRNSRNSNSTSSSGTNRAGQNRTNTNNSNRNNSNSNSQSNCEGGINLFGECSGAAESSVNWPPQ